MGAAAMEDDPVNADVRVLKFAACTALAEVIPVAMVS